MRNRLRIWGFLSLALMFLAAGCKRKALLDYSRVDYTLTADQLFKDYSDVKAANEKYLGKMLEVSGMVVRSGTDVADRVYVVFPGDASGDVQCFLDNTNTQDPSAFKSGQKLTLRGRSIGRVVHVALDNCRIQ